MLFYHKDLPHLVLLFTTFLQGTLKTLICFTEEFNAGGIISTATKEEFKLVFMPCTNDVNEGLLRMWCH